MERRGTFSNDSSVLTGILHRATDFAGRDSLESHDGFDQRGPPFRSAASQNARRGRRRPAMDNPDTVGGTNRTCRTKGAPTPAGEWQKSLCPHNLDQATLTGLEPATTGSTVRYSNQLSYSARFPSAVCPAGTHELYPWPKGMQAPPICPTRTTRLGRRGACRGGRESGAVPPLGRSGLSRMRRICPTAAGRRCSRSRIFPACRSPGVTYA